jgi:hypothetical protein
MVQLSQHFAEQIIHFEFQRRTAKQLRMLTPEGLLARDISKKIFDYIAKFKSLKTLSLEIPGSLLRFEELAKIKNLKLLNLRLIGSFQDEKVGSVFPFDGFSDLKVLDLSQVLPHSKTINSLFINLPKHITFLIVPMVVLFKMGLEDVYKKALVNNLRKLKGLNNLEISVQAEPDEDKLDSFLIKVVPELLKNLQYQLKRLNIKFVNIIDTKKLKKISKINFSQYGFKIDQSKQGNILFTTIL